MWLLIGDSHVSTLESFMDDEFDCEGFPGLSSEQAVRELEWMIEPILTEEAYKGCVICFGANDTGLLRDETQRNLKKLQELCGSIIPKRFVLGHPCIAVPYELPFYIDGIHLTAESAQSLARQIRNVITYGKERTVQCGTSHAPRGHTVDTDACRRAQERPLCTQSIRCCAPGAISRS
jgi:hypothetical protein